MIGVALLGLTLGLGPRGFAEPLTLGERVVLDRIVVRREPRFNARPFHERKLFESLAAPIVDALRGKLLRPPERRVRRVAATAVVTLEDVDVSRIPLRHGPHASGPMFLGLRGRLHLEFERGRRAPMRSRAVPLSLFAFRRIEEPRFSSAVLVEIDRQSAFEFIRSASAGRTLLNHLVGGNVSCARRLESHSRRASPK